MAPPTAMTPGLPRHSVCKQAWPYMGVGREEGRRVHLSVVRSSMYAEERLWPLVEEEALRALEETGEEEEEVVEV